MSRTLLSTAAGKEHSLVGTVELDFIFKDEKTNLFYSCLDLEHETYLGVDF